MPPLVPPLRRPWFKRLLLSLLALTLSVVWSLPGIGIQAALSQSPSNPAPLLPREKGLGDEGKLLITSSSSTPNSSVQQTVQQTVQQGVERYQAGDYKGAIALWQTALQTLQHSESTRQTQTSQIILHSNLARAQQQLGQSQTAIAQWDHVLRLARQLNDPSQIARALTEQAQIYSRIGQQRSAIARLCTSDPQANTQGNCTPDSALQLARQTQDPIAELAAHGSLGNAYRLLGDYDRAEHHLQASLQLAQFQPNPLYRLSALNSLGILYTTRAQVNQQNATLAQEGGDPNEDVEQLRQQAQTWDQKAIAVLEDSRTLAQTQNLGPDHLRSLLTLIPAYERTNANAQSRAAWQQARQLLTTLPDSRERVFAALDLVQLLQPERLQSGSRSRCLAEPLQSQAEPLLQQAIAVAQRIQDNRAESFALGAWAQLAECRQDWAQALERTEQARLAADQNLEAKDSLYIWEWQTGRILRSQWEATGRTNLGLLNGAIAAYERSKRTLETIRGDILTATRDLQFDFRDTIDPIYRELVELQLNRESLRTAALNSAPNSKLNHKGNSKENLQGDQQNFRSILQTIDTLKLAELQNYFGNNCVVSAQNQDSIDLGRKHAAAVFNTIILEDQTAVIVSLPDGQQRFHWIQIPRQQLIEKINAFRIGLEESRFDYDPKPAQQVYDWIIRPFKEELDQSQVNTLVFVQDGIFRTVPMAALHDGQQFLIQRYAIAITPSLTLTDAKPLQHKNLRVLALGLTKETTVDGKAFASLPNVSQELAGIQAAIPGSKKLLDEEFTRDRLKQELSQTVYPILHLATHGKFATNPEDTFIVTGDSKKLNFNELDQLIRTVSRNPEPLELLSLTACETAVGNDRSALGLAGVALQAGARSALASLWAVDDAATAKLSAEFYARLQDPKLTKAEALQAVQKDLLEGKIALGGDTQHPAYWSPFVLIGNWL